MLMYGYKLSNKAYQWFVGSLNKDDHCPFPTTTGNISGERHDWIYWLRRCLKLINRLIEDDINRILGITMKVGTWDIEVIGRNLIIAENQCLWVISRKQWKNEAHTYECVWTFSVLTAVSVSYTYLTSTLFKPPFTWKWGNLRRDFSSSTSSECTGVRCSCCLN